MRFRFYFVNLQVKIMFNPLTLLKMARFKIYYIDTHIEKALAERGCDVRSIISTGNLEVLKNTASVTPNNEFPSRKVAIDFLGLDEPDVLWYHIEEL